MVAILLDGAGGDDMRGSFLLHDGVLFTYIGVVSTVFCFLG